MKNDCHCGLIFGVGSAFLGLAEKYDYGIVSYLQGGGRVSGAAGNPSFLAGQMMVNTLLALALLGDRVPRLRTKREFIASFLLRSTHLPQRLACVS